MSDWYSHFGRQFAFQSKCKTVLKKLNIMFKTSNHTHGYLATDLRTLVHIKTRV